MFPHEAAAIQLSKSGKSLVRGHSVRYIFTDTHHSNPLCRVTALEHIRDEEELNYDKEQYRELLLEAGETVLSYFGFDRTIYDAKATRKKNRKWWESIVSNTCPHSLQVIISLDDI